MGHQLNPALVKLQRLSRGLSVRLRNLLLPREKTERIRIACLTWLPNCKERSKPINSRSRKLRRLQLGTWPSSGRLNKSLKRLKKGQSLQWLCKKNKDLLFSSLQEQYLWSQYFKGSTKKFLSTTLPKYDGEKEYLFISNFMDSFLHQ